MGGKRQEKITMTTLDESGQLRQVDEQSCQFHLRVDLAEQEVGRERRALSSKANDPPRHVDICPQGGRSARSCAQELILQWREALTRGIGLVSATVGMASGENNGGGMGSHPAGIQGPGGGIRSPAAGMGCGDASPGGGAIGLKQPLATYAGDNSAPPFAYPPAKKQRKSVGRGGGRGNVPLQESGGGPDADPAAAKPTRGRGRGGVNAGGGGIGRGSRGGRGGGGKKATPAAVDWVGVGGITEPASGDVQQQAQR